MKKPVFEGSATAIITPFRKDGIDYERMGKLLDFQADNGTAAIVIAGTTGENATLEIHEYESLVDFSIAHVAGKMKMIIGIGGNNTAQCLRKAEIAESYGADGLLMCPPYYNKTTQQGLISHFCHIADRSTVPLILYNVPSRTSIGITAETYKKLSVHPNINGVKEASGDFSLISRIFNECREDLNVWSGNDDNTIPMMAMGAKGVISVASNVLPDVVAKLCALCSSHEYRAAAALYQRYAEFFRLLFIETNPIPVKAALQLMDLDSGALRLPLIEISPEHHTMLKSCMAELGLI